MSRTWTVCPPVFRIHLLHYLYTRLGVVGIQFGSLNISASETPDNRVVVKEWHAVIFILVCLMRCDDILFPLLKLLRGEGSGRKLDNKQLFWSPTNVSLSMSLQLPLIGFISSLLLAFLCIGVFRCLFYYHLNPRNGWLKVGMIHRSTLGIGGYISRLLGKWKSISFRAMHKDFSLDLWLV